MCFYNRTCCALSLIALFLKSSGQTRARNSHREEDGEKTKRAHWLQSQPRGSLPCLWTIYTWEYFAKNGTVPKCCLKIKHNYMHDERRRIQQADRVLRRDRVDPAKGCEVTMCQMSPRSGPLDHVYHLNGRSLALIRTHSTRLLRTGLDSGTAIRFYE